MNASLPDYSAINDPKYDSYNRLRTLESKRPGIYFLLSMLLILVVNVGVLMLVSQGSLDLDISLRFGVASLILIPILFWRYRRREKTCHRCGGGLQELMRPLAINYDYLSRRGLILDGHFYSLRRFSGLKMRWTRLTRWTQACHHCKLLEERYSLRYLPVDEAEVEKIKQAIVVSDDEVH